MRQSDCGLSGYEYRKGKGGASAFLTKLTHKWEDKTGMNAKGDKMGMFRGQVQRLLPPSVQAKLDDVVGLGKKPFDEWEDTLIHYLGKYEKSKGSDPEEEKQALEMAWLRAQLKEANGQEQWGHRTGRATNGCGGGPSGDPSPTATNGCGGGPSGDPGPAVTCRASTETGASSPGTPSGLLPGPSSPTGGCTYSVGSRNPTQTIY